MAANNGGPSTAKKLLAFVRLSRPHFLLGGLLLFALGAMIARYQGYPLDLGLYLVGQLYVTSGQLMTHFLNEYWDAEGDGLNRARTPFSGGSGVLAEGALSRETAFGTALACMAVVSVAAIWLIFEYEVPAVAIALMALMFLGAFFYSSPPLALVGTGYGELAASVVVAGFVPAFGHMLHARQPSLLVLLATAPLIVFHFAMLLAFEFPDFLADEAAGKRTLLVRVGRRAGAQIHNAALVLAVGLTVAATFVGLPARVALAVVVASPLVLLQILMVQRLQRGYPVRFAYLTAVAVITFALVAYFMAFSFWVIG